MATTQPGRGRKLAALRRPLDRGSNPNLRILYLNSHRSSVVPGSEGLGAPRWSPDGQHISAISMTEEKLMLFDLKTQKWTLQAKTDADGSVGRETGSISTSLVLDRTPAFFAS